MSLSPDDDGIVICEKQRARSAIVVFRESAVVAI